MKNIMSVCFVIAFLSLGIFAQEDQFINEFSENGYVNSYEDGTEAVLTILEKESNLPVCRFSNQVRINSEFIPENRIGDVDTTSIEALRICQEEDVWAAVEEEMLVGMVVGTPLNFSPVLPMIGGGVFGCLMGYTVQLAETEVGTEEITPNYVRFVFYSILGFPGSLIGSIVSAWKAGSMPTTFAFFMKGLGAGLFPSIS